MSIEAVFPLTPTISFIAYGKIMFVFTHPFSRTQLPRKLRNGCTEVVTGDQKILQKLHNLCSSPIIIRMIKSRRMSWVRHGGTDWWGIILRHILEKVGGRVWTGFI
jgi:hypothetical protein